jgi:MFS family permease
LIRCPKILIFQTQVQARQTKVSGLSWKPSDRRNAAFSALLRLISHLCALRATIAFYSAVPAGAMLVSLTSGWTKRVNRHGLMVAIAAALWGVAIIGFGFAENLWLALFFLALAGAFDMVSGIFRMTIWNQTIPDHLRGRLAGIEMISYLTGPHLGNFEAGIVASIFSLRTSVVSGGVLCVVGTLVLSALLPRFIAYDGREGLKQKKREEAEREAANMAAP